MHEIRVNFLGGGDRNRTLAHSLTTDCHNLYTADFRVITKEAHQNVIMVWFVCLFVCDGAHHGVQRFWKGCCLG